MVERWDCIYVDRIDQDSRIYLTSPQIYGRMYLKTDRDTDEIKVRKSIPKDIFPFESHSQDNKILKAIAIAATFNRSDLKSSNGLVLRGFKGRTPFPGLQASLIQTKKENLRIKGTTGWLIYISPQERFFYIVDDYYKYNEISKNDTEMLNKCINYIEKEWKKNQ